MRWTTLFLAAVVGFPALAVFALGLPAWFGFRFGERSVQRIVAVAFAASAVGAACLAGALACGESHVVYAHIGSWFEVGHYAFRWTLVGDPLSAVFAGVSALLIGLVGAFSRRYLHREPGHFRFYFLLALFGAGVLLLVVAGSLDLVFFGWELVGVTSALLIAFFHERKKPVEHGLRAFITYRICDMGLLAAAVWLHYTVGTSAITTVSPDQPWAGFPVPGLQRDATLVALLLLWAAMGKAAQFPLGGWLPRAMEGPTPSSAIFYGAISIHLGPYLLLRSGELLERAPIAAAAVIVVGGLTAIHGTFVGRAQTDIKSVLAYASMTQVGLILVEIGIGWRWIPLIHIVGHAAVRSGQLLRSPSLLHDHHHLEQAMGQVPRLGGHIERRVPSGIRPWLYRHALERGHLDTVLRDHVIRPFIGFMRGVDGADRRFARWLRRLVGLATGRAVDDPTP